MPGTNILSAKAVVSNISPLGVWILLNNHEYFLSYEDYPEFMSASVLGIASVDTDIEGNLHWPLLDVDISLDALEHPEQYPLRYR